MRSSRLSRRERRALRFGQSVSSVPSTPHLTSSLLVLGAMTGASAIYADATLADVVTPDADSASRPAQLSSTPRVTIVQPAYADVLKGNTNIVIAVEGSSAAPKNVEMFVDGVSATNGAIPLSGLNSAQFDWKTTTVKDGLRRLVVRVTDEKGLRGEAETQVYINNSRTRDTAAPSLQWKNVRDGEMLHGQANLQLEASDNFGLKYIVITVNPLDNPDRTPALRASLINRAPFSYSLDTTRLPDGVYVLNARGYDVLDNEGATQRVTFGVSNNGLNPTVVEQLNEVLTATKDATNKGATKSPVATKPTASTRSGSEVRPDATTRTTLRIKPSIATEVAKTPKVIAPKIVAPKAAPLRVAKVKPSIVAQAPSIAQPSLTLLDSGTQTVEVSGVVSTSSALLGHQVSQKLSQPVASVRPSARRLAASHDDGPAPVAVASVNATQTAATPTEFAVQPGSVVSVRVAPPSASTGKERVAQRFEAPRDVARVAKADTPKSPVTALQSSAPIRAAVPTTPPRIARVENPSAVTSNSAPSTSAMTLSLPTTVVSSYAASSPQARTHAKTPQRMAALPTRRSDDQLSSNASLSAKIGSSNAAITVSPITLAALQTDGASGIIPATHVVKRGETISALAARYGLRAETLANVNGLKANSALTVGQKLSLPRALKVAYKGADANGDAQAFMVGSTGVAPFRFLFEQQGGTMQWDEAAQRVTATNGTRRVSINIGSREASVDDQKVMMDLAAFLLSGRTMVPVRFFEKAFDTRVEWEPATSRIYVAMSNDAALVR